MVKERGISGLVTLLVAGKMVPSCVRAALLALPALHSGIMKRDRNTRPMIMRRRFIGCTLRLYKAGIMVVVRTCGSCL